LLNLTTAFGAMSLTETPHYSHARLRAALGKKAFKSAFGAGVVVGMLGAGQAQAVVVNVGGQNWNVTTFQGSYNANSATFATPPAPGRMPWWGSESLASQFATAINSALGFPNFSGDFGPLFGIKFATGGTSVNSCTWGFGSAQCAVNFGNLNNTNYTWAQADLVPPVPGPLPLFGAAAAFGFSRKLRQRIKVSKAVGASATAV
jgi:hypothetical protein